MIRKIRKEKMKLKRTTGKLKRWFQRDFSNGKRYSER